MGTEREAMSKIISLKVEPETPRRVDTGKNQGNADPRLCDGVRGYIDGIEEGPDIAGMIEAEYCAENRED